MVSLTIPGIPVPKGRPRLSKYGAYTPAKTVHYEKLVQQCYMDQADGVKLQGALDIEIRFYFPIPKGYTKKQRQQIITGELKYIKKPDLDNLIKCVTDALNKFAYDDDSQIIRLKANKYYATDEIEPMAIIDIWEVDNE